LGNAENGVITFYDVLGRLLLSIQFSDGEIDFNFDKYKEQVLIYQVTVNGEIIKKGKFIFIK